MFQAILSLQLIHLITTAGILSVTSCHLSFLSQEAVLRGHASERWRESEERGRDRSQHEQPLHHQLQRGMRANFGRRAGVSVVPFLELGVRACGQLGMCWEYDRKPIKKNWEKPFMSAKIIIT